MVVKAWSAVKVLSRNREATESSSFFDAGVHTSTHHAIMKYLDELGFTAMRGRKRVFTEEASILRRQARIIDNVFDGMHTELETIYKILRTVYYLQGKAASISDIRRMSGMKRYIYSIIEYLELLGLVIRTNRGKKKTVRLTAEGFEVLEVMNEVFVSLKPMFKL